MSNIINAIYNLVNNPVVELRDFYKSKNRANSMGDALEEYIKDLFANTVNETDEQIRLKKISETFSYLGNQNNPPDSILRLGDVIEVKKVDPLGITDLRVRGMWSIENPFKVFNYIYSRDFSKRFNFMCVIREKKYQSFENTKLLEECIGKIQGFNISDVKIKNPNNPALLEESKLITFQI